MKHTLLAYFGITDEIFATFVLLLVSGIVILLFIGWYFGARRLDLDIHHRVVYTSTALITLIVLIWMGPRAYNVMNYFLNNIPATLPQLIHITLGLITVILMLIVVLTFLWHRTITIDLLKKLKPVMIAILTLFPIVFVIGVFMFTRYLR